MFFEKKEHSGGIFTERPFEPNIKCIIFAIIIILAYLYLHPKPNYAVLPILFISAYVGLAWYDYVYQCNDKMYTGKSGIAGIMDSIFKPQRRSDEPNLMLSEERQKHLLPMQEQEREYLKKVYLFHSIMVAAPLIYIGYKGKETNNKIFGYVLGLGVLAGAYHITRLFIPRESCIQ